MRACVCVCVDKILCLRQHMVNLSSFHSWRNLNTLGADIVSFSGCPTLSLMKFQSFKFSLPCASFHVLLCRAFDVELLYIAQQLHMPVSEVAVNWKEIEGVCACSCATDLFLIRGGIIPFALYV